MQYFLHNLRKKIRIESMEKTIKNGMSEKKNAVIILAVWYCHTVMLLKAE